MVPLRLQTTGTLGDLSSAKWLCLLRQTGLEAMQTKSHRCLEEAQGSDSPNNTLVRWPQNTSEDTLFSKYLLPRTTKVRVTIQMSIINESDHFLKSSNLFRERTGYHVGSAP